MINAQDATVYGLPFNHDKLPERLLLKGNSDVILEKLVEDCDWDYAVEKTKQIVNEGLILREKKEAPKLK